MRSSNVIAGGGGPPLEFLNNGGSNRTSGLILGNKLGVIYADGPHRCNEADPNLANNRVTQVTTGCRQAGDGPSVVRLKRFGFHRQPTLLVLYFSADALDPARASDYQVTSAGADGVYGTKDDKTYDVRSATHDSSRRSETLAFDHRLYLYDRYSPNLPQHSVSSPRITRDTVDFISHISLT